VYIIFRCGGTLVTMTMGWLLVGKRYNKRQIASVVLLTGGVILATWSNARNQVLSPNVNMRNLTI
jgi:UDP-xylose/UDP-N-acetylglucosamine transporter B4